MASGTLIRMTTRHLIVAWALCFGRSATEASWSCPKRYRHRFESRLRLRLRRQRQLRLQRQRQRRRQRRLRLQLQLQLQLRLRRSKHLRPHRPPWPRVPPQAARQV